MDSKDFGDDHVLIKVNIPGVPPVVGRSQDCEFTGTVLQVGSKVAKVFGEGGHVAGHTYVATREGSCLDVSGATRLGAYHKQWERVKWSL